MNDLSDRHESLHSLAGFFTRFTAFVADALRYWEVRRFIYNGVLFLVVLIDFVRGLPASRAELSFDVFLGLFILAVVANIAFCAVYAIDLFIQMSGLEAAKRFGRPAVLIVGTAFAATIAHFVAQSGFVKTIGP
jgi:hypothetical protein